MSQRASVLVGDAKRRRDTDTLLQFLIDTDRGGRVAAANALGELGTKCAVNPLVRSLNSSDWVLRSAAIRALTKIQDPRAVDAIASVGLEDESIPVRVAAAVSLQRFRDGRAIDVLLSILETSTSGARLRRWAADQLVGSGSTAALAPLERVTAEATGIERLRMRRRVRRLQMRLTVRFAEPQDQVPVRAPVSACSRMDIR